MKLENILLEENKDFDQIKIADFGGSTLFSADEGIQGEFGTTEYMAPEVGEEDDDDEDVPYNEKCDIWSIGVITYFLLAGNPPFDAKTESQIIERVKNADYNFDDPIWNSISDNAKDFIRTLLTLDPNERPSAEEALKSPWLRQNSFQLDQNDGKALI